MQISKKSQYGMRAMVFLAKNFKKSGLATIKNVSESEAIPFDFLEKIFSNLESAGLVRGKKGFGGGYVLAKSPAKITAKNIVDALEKTTSVDCSFCRKAKKCASKNVWGKVDRAIGKTLASIKLSNLAK